MWVIGFVRYVRIKKTSEFRLLDRDIRLLFFPLCYQHDGGKKKTKNGTVLNLAIKLQWASFFLESSIMINDRMNKKRLKLIGALFDKLLHFGNSLYRWCRSIRRLDMLSSKTTNKAQMSLVLFKIIDHD